MKKSMILAIVLVSCSKNPPQLSYTPPAVPVTTAEVVIRDVPLYFEEMGMIVPSHKVEVKAQVNGVIKAIHFQEGQWVNQGDLLYTIDPASYAIKVQEAEAQLLQNLAHLNNAKKKLERYRSLTKQDLIAQVEWDELETRVSLCESMVKADQARLATAGLDLDHCHIVAPISGRSGKTVLQSGNCVASLETLVTLLQEKTFFVDFALTEQEFHQLSSEQPVIKVYAAGGEECLAGGKVTFVDYAVDPDSGMLSARGVLTEMHKQLFSGQTVRVHLFFGERLAAKLVPLKAIKTNQLGAYLYSVNDDHTVQLRNVQLGPEENGMIVVEEGLEGATKIVTEGQSRLFPASLIEEISR